jgi:hypothetical protein
MHRTALTVLGIILLAGTVAVPAQAQAPLVSPAPTPSSASPTATSAPASPTATVTIDPCTVRHSRNAGGFTYAYCSIVTQAPAGQTVSVRYRSNLATYKPAVPNGDYDPQSKTVAFTGGGDQIQSVKLAFKKLTVAQVTSRLKVTLSDASGATITNATATPS